MGDFDTIDWSVLTEVNLSKPRKPKVGKRISDNKLAKQIAAVMLEEQRLERLRSK